MLLELKKPARAKFYIFVKVFMYEYGDNGIVMGEEPYKICNKECENKECDNHPESTSFPFFKKEEEKNRTRQDKWPERMIIKRHSKIKP